MLDRLKIALVRSYIGAIGLGWLLAQGLMHLTGIVTAPLAIWVQRYEFPGMSERVHLSGSPLAAAMPELVRGVCLLLLCYALLRWLYFKPIAVPESSRPLSDTAG
jgi:ABC-type sulfate transport system permease component